jgi:lipid-binding SYLF domain-containing protein/peptidoglycan hydrolase-like protein with peptidoglycan-binding domain
MSVNKLGVILFSSFLIFATSPLASAQSNQDQNQNQTKQTNKGTAKKETGQTADKNAPTAEDKTGTTEKTETGKAGAKKAKKTSSMPKDKVREAQTALKSQGFDPGPIDGIMGPMTMTAIRNYQSHNHMEVTGTLTPETENALLQGSPAGTVRTSQLSPSGSFDQNQQQTTDQSQQTYDQNQQTYGTDQTQRNLGQTQSSANSTYGTASEPAASSVEDVKRVQQQLADLQYNPGDVNGMMTSDTQRAIREFQMLNNLPVTGIMNEQTKIALDRQWNGGVQNAQLGQAPLSAEREKPTTELQQNRTDTDKDHYSKDTKHGDHAAKMDKEAADRVTKAAAVLQDLTASADKRIPNELLEHAEAIAVIPHMIKGAFGIGGRYGKGVVSERAANGQWSAPAFIEIGGGSFGAQIGATATDLVLVFTDRKAMDTLENGKDLKLGVDAGVVAGPIGREAEAGTNAKLQSAIFAYSRAKGLFAGVALDGAVLNMDKDMNQKVYGTADAREILNGNVAMNATGRPFVDALDRSVPKKRISQK